MWMSRSFPPTLELKARPREIPRRPHPRDCRLPVFAEDRQTLCKAYPDGNGLVFRCLQDNREKLKPHCREAVFDQVRGSQRKACF